MTPRPHPLDPGRLLDERARVRSGPGADRRRDAELRDEMVAVFAPERLALRVLGPDDAPAVLDQVIAHDAVHPIAGRDDLSRRLAPDRRILALEHEEVPDRLLAFVEVALCTRLDVDMPAILTGEVTDPTDADTAIFYSINRCEPGVAGLDVPAELLRRAIPELRHHHPGLAVFSTLSPIPSLRRRVEATDPDLAARLEPGWDAATDDVRDRLRLAAQAVTAPEPRGRVPDPVARFHLGNGARRVALREGADPSPRGIERSWGLMANYQYAP